VSPLSVTVAIPTFQREKVLVETIEALLRLADPPDELLVVDQSPRHGEEVGRSLADLDRSGHVTWLRLSRPSIPVAMNAALLKAKGDIVLFLDDDVLPRGELVAAHRRAHSGAAPGVVVGQVLEPGQQPEPLTGGSFAFRSSVPQPVSEFIGCNVSMDRGLALRVGGFDESFRGAAYRYELEFSARMLDAGGRLWFEPAASVLHLRAPCGGTRRHGSHLTTARPHHAVGEYYYLLRTRPRGWRRAIVRRLVGAVRTRHHLRRPWWIPVTGTAEVGGLIWAALLAARRPGLLPPESRSPERHS